MATNRQNPITYSLQCKFNDVELEHSQETLNIKIKPDAEYKNINVIIEDPNISVTKKVRAEDRGQTNAPAIIRASSLGSEGFNPANALIPVGLVQLNQTDEYLRDLPDEATALYLISPRSTADIFRDSPHDLGVWLQDIADIRNISENQGFHHDGKLVTGMDIYDHCEAGHSEPYGRERAHILRTAWTKAITSGQNVMTGFSIVTPELIRGYSACKTNTHKVVYSNLRDNVFNLNNVIRKQNCKNGISQDEGIIITDQDSGYARWQFTSAEYHNDPSSVYNIFLVDGSRSWDHKKTVHSSSRGGALQIIAPN